MHRRIEKFREAAIQVIGPAFTPGGVIESGESAEIGAWSRAGLAEAETNRG
jgi:hypothetical protein